jgi:hypothetical protein
MSRRNGIPGALVHALRQDPMWKGELRGRAHSIDDLLVETVHESDFGRSASFAMISSEMRERSEVPVEQSCCFGGCSFLDGELGRRS